MPGVKGNELLVVSRIAEFCTSGVGWNRHLWFVGNRLALMEVLEAVRERQEGVLSEAALTHLQNSVCVSIGQDLGAGDGSHRRHIQECLKSTIKPDDINYHKLQMAHDEVSTGYLSRWATAVESGVADADVERISRLVASHLMDLGWSAKSLSRTLRSMALSARAPASSLAELLRHLCLEAAKPMQDYEGVVPIAQAPLSTSTASPHWMTSTRVVEWLNQHKCDYSDLRRRRANIVGGLMVRTKAHDLAAAERQVHAAIETMVGRITIGTRSPFRHLGVFWIGGQRSAVGLSPARRGVEVRSLERQDQLYVSESENPQLDAATSLLGVLDNGAPGAAIAAGWAAMEALLLAATESGDHVRVADRMAAIAACSFIRAELTSLAYVHGKEADDALADAINAAATNRERTKLMADALKEGHVVRTSRLEDDAAVTRVRLLLARPAEVLGRVQSHHSATFRRFYRQRNLIMHGGQLNGVALDATLRTTAPLVGAVLDRIHHAWVAEGIDAVQLAARAQRNLEMIGTAHARGVTALLEP